MENYKRVSDSLRELISKKAPLQGADHWGIDGNILSYNAHFEEALKALGVKSFEELLLRRREKLGKPQTVLDLFGGAYFLEDLENVSSIYGVRLDNVDFVIQDRVRDRMEAVGEFEEDIRDRLKALESVINSPKRQIIETNLYTSKGWREVRDLCPPSGFDLIVCRPEGPFGYNNAPPESSIWKMKNYKGALSSIFLALFKRVLPLLSTNEGLLFLQVPNIRYISPEEVDVFEKVLFDIGKEGYIFIKPTNNRHYQYLRTHNGRVWLPKKMLIQRFSS